VRLHAAVALSESGGAGARDKLLVKLDGVEELDRGSVLAALGGILARAPSDAAVTRLSRALDLAAGPERDALLEAIGRTRLPSALRVLAQTAGRADVDDRRTAAVLLAVHDAPEARAAAARLLDDADASVRAQAAWSLGLVGDGGAVPALASLLGRADADPAISAAAAIGRIAARAKDPSLAVRSLCPATTDLRPLVRANAFAGLGLAGARCADGSSERRALESDPSDAVRAAAALAIEHGASTGPEDKRALERCAQTDRSGAVAQRCRDPKSALRDAGRAPVPSSGDRDAHRHAVTVYPVAEGNTTPKAHAAFALALADGTIHAGTSDRRGAALEPLAPEGEVALLRRGAR
jgi:HEAT repeat protein